MSRQSLALGKEFHAATEYLSVWPWAMNFMPLQIVCAEHM